MKHAFHVFVALAAAATMVYADNWPAWRGPTGQGHSEEKNLPLQWSAKENVKWKVPLANPGNSTPVIWGDKIFLTQANKDGTVRSLLCLARADGKLLWQKDVEYADKEKNWGGITYTNASAVTDGERVVACFASAGLYCYDFDGKELWKRTDLGKWEHQFGNGSSPLIYQDLVIQWCGPNETNMGRNFLIAVDKKTGKTIWEKDQHYGSWSTPLITKVNDQDQLILGMSRDVKGAADPQTGYLKGFDPKTGNEIWNCRGLDSYNYTSPLYANGIAVAMSGYGGSAIAVKLGGTGDITKDRLWLHPKNIQRVGSGLIVGEHVYIVEENGVPHCYELMTGKEVWKVESRPGGLTWGSMVHADGKLYVLCRNGQTLVFAASPKYELLATNSLDKGDQTNSSIAISDGEIFIRTFKNLWCIRAKK